MRKKLLLLSIIIFTMCMFIGTSSYAAWWGTPGYEWALTKSLTSIKTQAQLNRTVTLSDYYDTIIKYLKLKGVEPKDGIVQSIYVDNIYNGAIEGMIREVNTYISATTRELTPQQYRSLSNYIDHSKSSLNEYEAYLTRDDLKNLNLYFDLAKYRGASLLSDDTKIEREYKKNILYSLRNTKYHDSLTYGIMPMVGRITRGDFLVLMHNLLSDRTITSNDIIRSFNDSGVLLGYSNNLWLEEELRYSEMLTFLHRFENYDFNSSNDTTENDTTTNEEA